jgi:hypothetical protein
MQFGHGFNDIYEQVVSWFSKSFFVIATAFLTSIMSVAFRIHTGKIEMSKRAIFASILLSFFLSLIAANIWSYTFGTEYEAAVAGATALLGREVVTWLFSNHEAILYGLAERFKIKLKRKKNEDKED